MKSTTAQHTRAIQNALNAIDAATRTLAAANESLFSTIQNAPYVLSSLPPDYAGIRARGALSLIANVREDMVEILDVKPITRVQKRNNREAKSILAAIDNFARSANAIKKASRIVRYR